MKGCRLAISSQTLGLDGLDLMSGLVLEDGRRWGEAAEPFQWEDAQAVLNPDAVPYHFLTRARGGSKTTDLAGVAIAMLLTLPDLSRLHWLAADREQGALAVDAIAGFVARTPMLRGAFEVRNFQVGFSATGSSLEILAADAPGAWGLRTWGVFVDEIAQWATTSGPRRLWEAVSSAVAKNPSARMVVLTTAGDPAHWSYRILEHAQVDPLWRVHEVPGPAPWTDLSRLEEQQRRLPESSYRRLFQNQWTASEDRLTSHDDLLACVTLDGPLPPKSGMRYVIGVDLGLKSDRTVAVVCHEQDARVVMDRIAVWGGTRTQPVQLDEVELWLHLTWRSYNKARVVMDPWQAVALAQRLRTRGVHVTEFVFSSQSVGRLATTLHLLIRNGDLALPNDPELVDELLNVQLRETSPGVYRMDHDPDKHDDRAIALALASHHLVNRPKRQWKAY